MLLDASILYSMYKGEKIGEKTGEKMVKKGEKLSQNYIFVLWSNVKNWLGQGVHWKQ